MVKIKFYEKVYLFLKKIPSGKVVTYKELARAIKSPKSSRAVGNALNKNPFPAFKSKNFAQMLTRHPISPTFHPKIVSRNFRKMLSCHRVIKSDGKVGGYVIGTNKKIQLLRKEGVEVINGNVDLKKYGFKF